MHLGAMHKRRPHGKGGGGQAKADKCGTGGEGVWADVDVRSWGQKIVVVELKKKKGPQNFFTFFCQKGHKLTKNF